MKERVILHSDLNNFYASVECLYNPQLRGKPVAVCGDAELRHGIVLAKNYIAKEYGIKTGDVIWEAKQKCPGLVVMSANFKRYMKIADMVRDIYKRYTNHIESLGIDECWLDVTGNDGSVTADRIRADIRAELGITASIGVSWNKIFAKLGSDMKKPDATTLISRQNYTQTAHLLPVEELLYVGRATKAKLNKYSIRTIGDLAASDPVFLKARLGKWGEYLWSFANGYDMSPVCNMGTEAGIKSIGNSTTTVRDLKNESDVRMIVTVLAESVAARLRERGLKGGTVELWIRDCALGTLLRQAKLPAPTFISGEIIEAAMALFRANYTFGLPIRSVGVRASGLCAEMIDIQTDMFGGEEKRSRQEKLETAIDEIRRRFGHFAINRAVECADRRLTDFNPKDENLVHPFSYF